MAKIYKASKISFFIIIFIISFFVSKIFSVNAAGICSSGCNSDTSGKNCTWDNEFFGGDAYTCSINTSQTISGPSIMPNGNCVDSTNLKVCVRAMPCPATFNNPAANGKTCEIRSAAGFFGCTSLLQKSGKWDASQSQCVHCSGQMADRVYNVSGSSATDVAITPKCESACGGASDDQPSCAPVCTRTNPTVNVVGSSSQTKAAGITATYPISVTNNDSFFSCSATDFVLTYSGCAGWKCSINTASTGLINGGTSSISGTITLSVTAPVGTPPGTTKDIKVIASGNGKSGEATATYVVAPAGAIVVTTSPSSISASTNTPVTFFVTLPVAVAAAVNVSLSTVQSCTANTNAATGAGTCSLTVNSALNIDVTASKSPYPDGTAIITVAAAPGCTAGTCGGVGGAQWCNAGAWANCTPGRSCVGGACVIVGSSSLLSCTSCGPAAATSGGCNDRLGFGLVFPSGVPSCAKDADILSMCGNEPVGNGCVIGFTGGSCSCGGGCVPATCAGGCADGMPCAGGGACSGGVCVGGASENCAVPGDEDGNGLADCADPACSALPECAPCSGPGMYISPLGPGYCTIGEILTKATNWILSLVASIIILILVIGGLMYISSSGDEERLRTSKNIILYAVIGLGIILISYALITEVTNILKGP